MLGHGAKQRCGSILKITATSFLCFALNACGGGSSNDSPSVDDTSISEPSDNAPADNVETPWVNGFRLVREISNPNSALFSREELYRIGDDGRTIERFSVSSSGETEGFPSVIHHFDEMGFIVSRENVRSDGTALQTFDSSYDAAGRKTGEQSYNDNIPFLTSVYTFETDAGPIGQRVTSTANGGLFSDRVYTYAADGTLASIRLSSPALTDDLLNEYSYDAAAGRPIEIREIDVSTGAVDSSESLSYDVAGNLVRIERFGADGANFSETVFEYEATSEIIPNLPLHEITHDIDTF